MTRCLHFKPRAGAVIALLAFALAGLSAQAGPLRERLRERLSVANSTSNAPLPQGVRVLRDVAYGADPNQTFDVYLPEQAEGAPVIFMVHGGGWKHGDKTMARSLGDKVARWVPRGFIFVTTNYRMLPDALPDVQLRDVARAVAVAQSKAAAWGGDRRRFILMGHSAGAHLIALLAASPRVESEPELTPILGSVALDSAAMDVTRIMEQKHFDLYDAPFGTDPAYWKAMSPINKLAAGASPTLAVCSSRRQESCDQAQRFAERARWVGNRIEVLREDLSHGEINGQLCLAGAYTDSVETFMASLDAEVARRLGRN